MRFRRKINYRVRPLSKNVKDRNPISNISSDETMSVFVQAFKVVEISGVSESAEIDNFAEVGKIKKHAEERRADESRSTSNEKFTQSFWHHYIIHHYWSGCCSMKYCSMKYCSMK
jgi:hypothetical protein